MDDLTRLYLFTVQGASLSANNLLRVDLPEECTAIWLPPQVVLPSGDVRTNNAGQVFQLGVNDPSMPLLTWGLGANFWYSASGRFQRLYLMSSTGPLTNPIYLLGIKAGGFYGGFNLGNAPAAAGNV